jgi:hypothetical protein
MIPWLWRVITFAGEGMSNEFPTSVCHVTSISRALRDDGQLGAAQFDTI